eukprot:m.229274 g.229274  ORF g.229274 m.229274 type:complete len:74 (+) comp15206_c1_seq6:2105-2326(+)
MVGVTFRSVGATVRVLGGDPRSLILSGVFFKGSTTLSWKLRQFRGDQTKGSAPIKRASQSSVTQCICAHARVC